MTNFQAADSALLYHAHHARHPEDLPFWLDLAQRYLGDILELGCGTGRVLLPLAQTGRVVVGVDNDPAMLSLLKAQWPARPVTGEAPSPAPAILADFTALDLPRRFGLVCLPCNTYSTLAPSERRATLAGVGRCLLANGVFAVSMPNPLLLRALPRRSPLQFEERFPHPVHGAEVQVFSGWQRSPTWVRIDWQYRYTTPAGESISVPIAVRHWLTPIETLMEEFAGAGFRVLAVYGDYDGAALDQQSTQLIIIAQTPPPQA
jgi:SAM-dependent methyltransferase